MLRERFLSSVERLLSAELQVEHKSATDSQRQPEALAADRGTGSGTGSCHWNWPLPLPLAPLTNCRGSWQWRDDRNPLMLMTSLLAPYFSRVCFRF